MNFSGLIQQMIDAACRGDGAGVAACLTPEGVCDDVFYGSFHGRSGIERMIYGPHRHDLVVIVRRRRA